MEYKYSNGKDFGEETKSSCLQLGMAYKDDIDWWGDIDTKLEIEYSYELEEKRNESVKKGIIKYLKDLQIDFNDSDDNDIWKKLSKLYKDQGIELESTRKVVKNWLAKGTVGETISNRKNMYNLCVALKLNIEQTYEFFFKYFFTIPFNFKDKTDAVYYYCINNHKPYSTIKELLNKVQDFHENSSEEINTKEIGRQIGEIDDDNEFLLYIQKHCFSEDMQMSTAKKIINEIYQEINIKEVNEFLKELYGYDPQYYAKKQEELYGESKGISKSILPRSFTKSIPMYNEMSKILNKEKVSYETLRKAIILLFFYYCYPSSEYPIIIRSNDEIKELLENFYEETNKKLESAGFIQMYPNHPFDWLILYCAYQMEPSFAFHELIAQYYLNEIEPMEDDEVETTK